MKCYLSRQCWILTQHLYKCSGSYFLPGTLKVVCAGFHYYSPNYLCLFCLFFSCFCCFFLQVVLVVESIDLFFVLVCNLTLFSSPSYLCCCCFFLCFRVVLVVEFINMLFCCYLFVSCKLLFL